MDAGQNEATWVPSIDPHRDEANEMTDSTILPRDQADELERLRQRVSELEQRLEQAEQERRVYKLVVQNAPAMISRLTPDGLVIYGNTACERIVGKTSDEMAGLNLLPILYPGELMKPVEEYFRIAAAGGAVEDYELEIETYTGERRIIAWNNYNSIAPNGDLMEIVSFGIDITTRKRDEIERKQLQEDVIAMQAAALAELSTPLIPIGAHIVAMPLIGSIDQARAERIMNTLLLGIRDTHAATAILDVTGVTDIDTLVANGLLRAARAARLLGARVILTGIRPDVARTLVSLGTDFEGIVTRGTLESGIQFAMQQQR
jgi:rsbT co-antagonist protein RsbR